MERPEARAPSRLRSLSWLEVLKQIHDPHVQCVCDDLQGLKRHVAFASFDLAHVRTVQARFIGKYILRPSAFEPECPDGRPDLLLDVLHQKQFRGTLGSSILVITSR